MKAVKKIMKLIVIILIAVVAIATVLFAVSGYKATHYWKSVKTGGDIEAEYSALGSLKVSSKEFPSQDETIGKFAVWYPSELENSDKAYPVVLWANGTGSTSSTYTAFFRHLASWGFIVVGNDDENTRTGESLNKAIDLLIQENGSEDSILYNKIDLDRIGISGHSQGGPAVFNMAVNQPHADMIKTVYAVSATSSYHTRVFGDGWEYDISKVNVPTFLTAGTGSFDAGTATSADQESDEKAGIMQGICPLWSLEENFGLLPDSVDKAYGRKTGVDHGNSYLQCDGYMTAWFRYYLTDDEEAGKAFFGENAEILSNPDWQDVRVNRNQ